MKSKRILNYSHGKTLQSLCNKILFDEQKNYCSYRKWILYEQDRLLKKQSPLWSIPKSTESYYYFLNKLREILTAANVTDEITLLLNEINECTKDKINALFLTQEISCWPSLESVFAAVQHSENYEFSLVYIPFSHVNFTEQTDYYDTYKAMGLPILRHNEYDLIENSPDIAFVIKPYANIPEPYQTRHLEAVISRLIYIPYGMEITMDLIQYGFQYYTHYKAWRHCAYGNIVKEYGTKYGYRNGENIAVWGHPKADHYIHSNSEHINIPSEWGEIIRGRKVILWTPHHLVDLNSNGTGTWLIWGERILNEAVRHPDICFIFRPHPLMFGALINNNYMSQQEVDLLLKKIQDSDNIIYDANASYLYAFNAADAIITDGTTFSVEFLYTQKPILLTPRNMDGFYIYHEMLESYYIVRCARDITNFMEMIQSGKDPLKSKRLSLYNRLFFIPGTGTVGEYILQEIKKELTDECEGIKMLSSDIDVYGSKEIIDEQKLSPSANFPLFSILVLCYRNQDLLFAMLDSIFMQDYPRIQLIVSDDGSPDFDTETVEQYINLHKRSNIEQVLVRKNEINMKTVPHIHHAITYVRGDYLVFTAADDRFACSDVITTYVESFLSNPEKVWLVAKCNMTTPDYKKVRYVTPTSKDEFYFLQDDAHLLFSRWSRRGMAIPCCMAFKMTAFDLVGGIDLDYLFLEDWPLELKLLRNGNAPIFCNKLVAIHSTGGISNANNRYGKELKRLFYNDKYTLMRKEVEPYLSLLTPEDKKAYKLYMKEIMERHYFFYIDWPDTTTYQRLKLCLRKPIRFWWAFELKFNIFSNKIPKKKLLIGSQFLFALSVLFLNANPDIPVSFLYQILGWINIILGLFMMITGAVTYPLQKHFKKKAKLRTELIN